MCHTLGETLMQSYREQQHLTAAAHIHQSCSAPADVVEVLEYLVATMQMLLDPVPLTEKALRQHPTSYLS